MLPFPRCISQERFSQPKWQTQSLTSSWSAPAHPEAGPASASRSLASKSLFSRRAALSPTLSGALLATGWIALPLVGCGVLKIVYDLTLWRAMRQVRLDSA